MPRTQEPANVPPAQRTFGELLPEALLNAFNTNDRINHYLIDSLAREAWMAKPPAGKGRSIPQIVAHMHNVRIMWLKASANGSRTPAQLDRTKLSPTQALRGLEQS